MSFNYHSWILQDLTHNIALSLPTMVFSSRTIAEVFLCVLFSNNTVVILLGYVVLTSLLSRILDEARFKNATFQSFNHDLGRKTKESSSLQWRHQFMFQVDWSLFGRPPPRTPQEWEIEFDKYKQSPEFKYKNSEIAIEDFKFIW